MVTIRPARTGDVDAIASLVNGYAAQAVMLPRSTESVALALDDFVVAVDGRNVVMACGALKTYAPSLAEVASLAVSPAAQGHGLGRRVVDALEALARRRDIQELFALTLTPAFFEALGYAPGDRARYPEKVKRDCATCPRHAACAEVCVSRLLGAVALDVAA